MPAKSFKVNTAPRTTAVRVNTAPAKTSPAFTPQAESAITQGIPESKSSLDLFGLDNVIGNFNNRLGEIRGGLQQIGSAASGGPIDWNKWSTAFRNRAGSPAPTGWLSGPGPGEQFFSNTKDFYTSPTRTGGYFDSNANFFGQPTEASGMFGKSKPALTSMGAGESRAYGLAGRMQRPGVGQDFTSSTLGSQAGKMDAGNQAQQAWDAFRQNKPTLASDPGLGSYYDNAKRRANESIRQNMASAGAYGSSATADQTREAMTNLDAERANREAQYNLQRIAEQRGWEGLGGQLAGNAAASQLGWATGLGSLGLGAEQLGLGRETAAAQTGLAADTLGLNRILGGINAAQGVDEVTLSRILGGGSLAGAADTAALARLTGGQQAAMGAQNLGETRGMNEFVKPLMLGQAGAPIMSSGYENLFSSDQGLRDAASAALFGMGNEAIRGERAGNEAFWNDVNQPVQTVGNVMSMVYGRPPMGGGGGGTSFNVGGGTMRTY